MELAFWIVIIAVVLFRMSASSSSKHTENDEMTEDRHLTETQRRWHKIKREQALITADTVADEYDSKYEQLVKLQVDAQRYILDNKRPFILGDWMVNAVNPLMIEEYIRYMGFTVGLFVFLAFIGVLSTTLAAMMGLNVLVIDLFLYRKQLILEVTEWNPEFQEKFAKKLKNLVRGMNIH